MNSEKRAICAHRDQVHESLDLDVRTDEVAGVRAIHVHHDAVQESLDIDMQMTDVHVVSRGTAKRDHFRTDQTINSRACKRE